MRTLEYYIRRNYFIISDIGKFLFYNFLRL